jgi:hypothetical protein
MSDDIAGIEHAFRPLAHHWELSGFAISSALALHPGLATLANFARFALWAGLATLTLWPDRAGSAVEAIGAALTAISRRARISRLTALALRPNVTPGACVSVLAIADRCNSFMDLLLEPNKSQLDFGDSLANPKCALPLDAPRYCAELVSENFKRRDRRVEHSMRGRLGVAAHCHLLAFPRVPSPEVLSLALAKSAQASAGAVADHCHNLEARLVAAPAASLHVHQSRRAERPPRELRQASECR